MATATIQPNTPSTVVSAGASPVTVVIPSHSEPVVLTVTAGAAITVTGRTVLRPVDIDHTP